MITKKKFTKWSAEIGILVLSIRLLLQVNCKYILYTILFLICLDKNLISRLKEPQVWMNDPYEDKALGGWMDKVQNLADERR